MMQSASSLPGADPAILAEALLALGQAQHFGLHLFDAEGHICQQLGATAPLPDDLNLSEHPLFLGLWPQIVDLLHTGGMIELASVALAEDRRFDLKIFWLEKLRLFCAFYQPAEARSALEGQIAQSTRETRLLLEKIGLQQAQILAQAELMRLFIEHVPAAVAMLDDQCRYVATSLRWRKELAQSDSDLTGKDFDEGLSVAAPHWSLALRHYSGKISSGVEKLVRADGKDIWIRWEQQAWHGAPQKLGEPAPHGMLILAEDISKSVEQTAWLRARASRLARMNEQAQSFALAASHDLRAPLRQILTFLDMFREDLTPLLPQLPQGDDLLQLSRDCALRMSGMLEALLAHARINQPSAAMIRPFALSEAIEAARLHLSDDIERLSAHIHIEGDAKVDGDFALLVSLFQNLLDNALKYADGSTLQIRIVVQASARGVVVVFEDDGPGIPLAQQMRAFDLFQRLHKQRQIEGHGVGLAICKRIAQVHGGDLIIDPAYQNGLRLILSLPSDVVR